MDFWQGFWLIGGIHLLAALSPGPDLILVTQQTVSHGRAAGWWTCLGIVLGLGVHISYSVLGLAVLVQSSVWLMDTVKILGGLYLLYLGIRGLRARAPTAAETVVAAAAPQTVWKTLRQGFLCNVLNPKAAVYFVALFTSVLSPQMPVWQLAAYGAWMMLLQFLCFGSVAALLSLPALRRRFQAAGHWIDRLLGAAMTGLGIKILAD